MKYSPTKAPAWLEQSSSLELLHGGFSSFCAGCAASKSLCALQLAEEGVNDSTIFEKLGSFVTAVQAFTKEFSTLKQRESSAELLKSLAGLDKNLEAIGNYIITRFCCCFDA